MVRRADWSAQMTELLMLGFMAGIVISGLSLWLIFVSVFPKGE